MIEITQQDYQQAEDNGISRQSLRQRVRKLKWSKEDAINTPTLTQVEITKRAAAATSFHKTNSLFFLKEKKR